jgi:hypothetical protein
MNTEKRNYSSKSRNKQFKILGEHPESLPYDFIAQNAWKLLSSAGFLTYVHHDAGGNCTYICMNAGMKIWCIIRPKTDVGRTGTVDPYTHTKSRLEATDAILNMDELMKHSDLFVLMLTPGSVLLV